jgi:hypothetical protein
MGAAALREKFLASGELRRSLIPRTPWGDVWVRELTASDREDIEERFAAKVDPKTKSETVVTKGMRAFVACRCVIDPDSGSRVFSDDDAAELSKRSDSLLARILAEVFKISEYGDQAEQEAVGK